jgi:hypothetical protein
MGIGLERSCQKFEPSKGGEDYKSTAEWNALNLLQIMTTNEEEEG